MAVFKAADGTELYFTDEGTGPAVLALAGLTRNGSDFDYVAPHLSGCRLIRLDYRGRGKSQWSTPETYNIPTEAGDAIALLDHLGLEKAAILGTSRGGLIAMVLAATAKDRLSGVCLVDVGPVIEEAALETIRNYLGRNPPQRTLDDAATARSKLIPGFDNVPLSRWREEVERHYVETPDGLVINYDPALRGAVLENMAQPAADLWPLYDALAGLPLALIRGVNSELLSLATADEMANRIPDLIRAEVPDRGHVPFLDEDESLSALRAWVEKLQ